jgi:F420-0:gamma-glutamyl ligase
LAHSGFAALSDYRGKRDVFGYRMRSTVVNIPESLAAAASIVMGEGDEQTPIALIEDVPAIHFQSRNPTKKELETLRIAIEDDIFAPILLGASWKRKGE